MRSHMRSFFSEKRARAFAEEIKRSGAQDVQISSARDGFGQTQYRVEWNYE